MSELEKDENQDQDQGSYLLASMLKCVYGFEIFYESGDWYNPDCCFESVRAVLEILFEGGLYSGDDVLCFFQI